MTPIVTCCDRNYLPGLLALHESFRRHSAEGFQFWAVVQGDEAFENQLRARGINVVLNPVFPVPDEQLATSWRYPTPLPVFYWRLMVPQLFAWCERSIYIDCDSIILQSLAPLAAVDMGEHPVAATRSNSRKGKEIGPPGEQGGKHGEYGPMSSLYVFDHQRWFDKRVLERCCEEMQRDDIEFYTIAQGLLQHVLGDDWHELAWETQAHATHNTLLCAPREKIFTIHYMGTKPWQQFPPGAVVREAKQKARDLWKEYAQPFW